MVTTPRGTKRSGAPEAKGLQPSKKAKVWLNGTLEAIAKAEDLPESCRSMLRGMAPMSLGTPSDERDKNQKALVRMIGGVIDDVRLGLQKDVEAEAEKVAAAEAVKAGCQKGVEAAEVELAAAEVVTQKKKEELAEVMATMLAAKAALAEAEKAKDDGNVNLERARDEEKVMKEAMEQDFQPLRDGGCDAAAAKQHMEAMIPLMKQLKVDESLTNAMPAACAAAPGERGGFDQMVFVQVEGILKERLKELAAVIASASPAAAEREAVVASAQGALATAKKALLPSAAVFREVQKESEKRRGVVHEAKDVVERSEPELNEAQKAHDERRITLESFVNWNAGSFEKLRDDVSESLKTERAIAAAAAAAEELAAATAAAGGEEDKTAAEP